MVLDRTAQNVWWLRSAFPEDVCTNVPHTRKLTVEPLAAALWVLVRVLDGGPR